MELEPSLYTDNMSDPHKTNNSNNNGTTTAVAARRRKVIITQRHLWTRMTTTCTRHEMNKTGIVFIWI